MSTTSPTKRRHLALAAVVLVSCGGSGAAPASSSANGGVAGTSSSGLGGASTATGGASTATGGASSATGGASTATGGGGGPAGTGLGGATAGGSSGGTNAGGANGGAAASGTSGASSGGTSGSSGGSAGAGGASAAGAGGAGGAGGGQALLQPFKGVAGSSCAVRSALSVSWYYNWAQQENEACTGGKGGAYVPMIWGHAGAEQTAASIQSAVAGFVSKGFKYVLGFNEPDNATQSNIAVAPAIALLPAFDTASIGVGTPATQANATGQTWFKSYMGDVAAGATLRADFIAIHWYGWNAGSCDASASQLESYIKYAEGFPGSRPIWLTEWGCLNLSAPTSAGVVDFYKGALAVFAKHPRVVRYAWYQWSPNCELVNAADGSLTDLGKAYAAAPSSK